MYKKYSIILPLLFTGLYYYFFKSKCKKLKVAYIILTCEKYKPTRVQYQKDTFIKNINKEDIYYISCKEDIKNRIFGWNTKDNYESCPLKYIRFFQNINLTDKYDYYAFIDDDTYVNTKNLNKYLLTLDSKKNLFLGSILTHLFPQFPNYMSGGAGIFITNSVYKNLRNYILTKSDKELLFTIYGDVSLGKWIYDSFHTNKNHIWENVELITNDNFHALYKTDKDDIKNYLTFHDVTNKEKFDEIQFL